MYNDFILVGPPDDPAAVKGMTDVAQALRRIAQAAAYFVSRGDDSGTHKRERELWRRVNIAPDSRSAPWYRESGSGMGATLNTASAMGAYTLADRGTWLAFKNRAHLAVAVEQVPPLSNQYGVIRVSEKKHPHVKAQPARQFVDWLLSEEGQTAIGAFKVNGVQLFHPNASR
jgi:tungstate transport system substrate-binding protein